MTLFFAQVTTNTTIQGWLNALVPLVQIVKICNAILPAFVLIAIMLLAIGYVISLCGSDEVFAPSISLIVLFACIAIPEGAYLRSRRRGKRIALRHHIKLIAS